MTNISKHFKSATALWSLLQTWFDEFISEAWEQSTKSGLVIGTKTVTWRCTVIISWIYISPLINKKVTVNWISGKAFIKDKVCKKIVLGRHIPGSSWRLICVPGLEAKQYIQWCSILLTISSSALHSGIPRSNPWFYVHERMLTLQYLTWKLITIIYQLRNSLTATENMLLF